MNFFKKIVDALLAEDFPIQQKLMNLVIATALVGAIVSFVVTLLIDASIYSSITTLVVIVAVSFALYFSIVKRMDSLAAFLVVGVADIPLLSVMYFTSGGVMSGMPMWFLLGLAVPIFILRSNKLIYPIFAFGAITFIVCILIDLFNPGLTEPLDQASMASDVAVSMVLVAIVFGAIFKFQSYVYHKQTKKLKEQDDELRKMMLELQNAMKDLEKANKAKSSFLANMSHEIRTPINAVLGMDEMILRETKETNIEKYAMNIRNSGQSLLSIINDILDFSKIESGKMELLPGIYEVSSLLSDCYNMVSMRAKEKDLKIVITNNPALPKTLYGDEFRIRQIITNLLTNAVKYTKHGNVIFDASFEREEDKHIVLRISVKDTGKGISKEDLQLLFNSFQRVNEQHNRNIEGTGLGLAITKQLVELMSGTISVESELGKGSEFVVCIPQVVVSGEPLGNFSSQYQNKSSNSEKYKELFQAPTAEILVVDDVLINLEVIKGLLKQTQVCLDCVTSGEQALERIETKHYDLILLDHMMPGMDGIETFEEIRKMPNGHDVPVIALTANALVGAAEEYIKLGFSGYLSKPVRSETLESTLLNFLPKEKVDVVSGAGGESGTTIIQKTFLQRLDFLDHSTGMLYCANDENLYREVLKSYAGSSLFSKIVEYFDERDWNKYKIQVHSLKSSSLTIGATKLSELAREQELLVINGEHEKAAKNHNGLVKAYEELLGKLRTALA